MVTVTRLRVGTQPVRQVQIKFVCLLHQEEMAGVIKKNGLRMRDALADIALASHVIGANLFKVDMSATPILQEIFSNCMRLPAFADAHPLKQAGAPQAQ